MSIVALTVFALLAFAANSLLCRLALGDGAIDPVSFTSIRIVSGAVALYVILFLRTSSLQVSSSNAGASAPSEPGRVRPRWRSAGALFAYAIAFSFAYLNLTAGTGALILFGTVQATMLAAAVRSGERPTIGEWIGLGCALAGLVYLVAPGLAAPSPMGAALMTVAGISWGLYSLWGRHAANPLADTGVNFLRAVPLAAVPAILAFLLDGVYASRAGIVLAMVSGAGASGLGYVAWYSALPALTATRAATVQLQVPVLTALAGLVVLDEPITPRLVVATVLVAGGIALAIFARRTKDTRAWQAARDRRQ